MIMILRERWCDAGCEIRDTGYEIRDAGFGMRDAGCGIRDPGCVLRVFNYIGNKCFLLTRVFKFV